MYMFYLDESGEREYTSPSRYFVLCTFGIKVDDWKDMNTNILTLKKTYFNDITVEIKSNWLRIEKERTKRYIQKYSISPEELTEFTNKLIDCRTHRKIPSPQGRRVWFFDF